MATPKTVSFYTLGCKLNYSETSSIAQQFRGHGYAVVPFESGADICVINTCSVTDFADRKCRKVVRQALKHAPDARIVLIGCYAQLKPDEIAEIPGVDLVLGAAEKFQVLHYVELLDKSFHKGIVRASEISTVNHFQGAFSFGDRTRSFLKVQDGCDYKCAFCTIPLARGRSRSDTVGHAVENARKLSEKGIREVVLTGVNIGDFGRGTEVVEGKRPQKQALFIDLIKALDAIQDIPRFRISSIEPNLCTDAIIEFVASSERFMPHFHMPLQSGNDKQLRQMRRRYKRALYQQRVELIRKILPHAAIGVDVITGFPGETDEDFLETYRFIQALDVSYLHVFTYSERPGTPAAEMPGKVPVSVRRERSTMLRTLSEKKKRAFHRHFLHSTRPVLFEKSKRAGNVTGFTDNYVKVLLEGPDSLINTIRDVRLADLHPDGVVKGDLGHQDNVYGVEENRALTNPLGS